MVYNIKHKKETFFLLKICFCYLFCRDFATSRYEYKSVIIYCDWNLPKMICNLCTYFSDGPVDLELSAYLGFTCVIILKQTTYNCQIIIMLLSKWYFNLLCLAVTYECKFAADVWDGANALAWDLFVSPVSPVAMPANARGLTDPYWENTVWIPNYCSWNQEICLIIL